MVEANNRRWSKISSLIAYYAILQVVHLGVLLVVARSFWISGEIGFPAPPPDGGWTTQADAFLLGSGILDGIVAVSAILAIVRYRRRAPGAEALLLVCLAASLSSGFIFVIGTALSGAWIAHPMNYLGLVAVFLPVAILLWLLL